MQVDIEVGDKLSQMANYEITWLGTEIKFIKTGRMLIAEGSVINIPDDKAQYMFVDWKYTKSPPCLAKIPGYNKPLTTNVFITRATVRPEVEKLTDLFKPGQRVKFVAREQAPNERGVCWRAALATDEYHDIVVEAPNTQGRSTHRVIPKAGVVPASPTVRQTRPTTPMKTAVALASATTAYPGQRPLMKPVIKPSEDQNSVFSFSSAVTHVSTAPSTSSRVPATTSTSSHITTTTSPSSSTKPRVRVTKPLPVDGFDYFDTSKKACNARFAQFATKYRRVNPTCLSSQKLLEGCLYIKYINKVKEELSGVQVGSEEK
ncbi:hypothetical protein GCK72_009693 [Caenorhabditis remanei]|uniref:Uncharacterized protein n=1 Tax=Caenorhabditis remanei TaxID=31234 RepID=A0A6A5H2L4_CAERE|nr:hypothetical protein GCK72_009693 [Caenorhabditis remanei]KAF1761437.1 hypothetical protein GCK72_009693 [Caenorhabditis remanei]